MPTPSQLDEIKRRLSERAIYKALLLSGEMPRELNEIFTASGAALMPDDYARSQLQCGCPEPENVCKHILAALYVAAAAFDHDPFLLLRMRGFDKESLLSSLTGPIETGEPDEMGEPKDADAALGVSAPGPGDPPEPIRGEADADGFPLDAAFYGSPDLPSELEHLSAHPAKSGDSHTPHTPLFGFPLWRGETPFGDSIAPYYESVEKMLRGKSG
jgi:hypothetical protein